jgi:hypothetical protein
MKTIGSSYFTELYQRLNVYVQCVILTTNPEEGEKKKFLNKIRFQIGAT